MNRVPWHQLPVSVRQAVRGRVGGINAVRDVPDGLTCSTAMLMDTEAGRLFVKGAPAAVAGAVAGQQWEAQLAETVSPVSPRLHWHLQFDGWDLLASTAVDGRHADLARADDQAKVAHVLLDAQALRPPAGLLVSRLADRFAGVLDPGRLRLLDGDALLHTDTNPHNLLVGAERAWLIDWAMPAVGPAWVDVAYTAVRLMEADCTPAAALAWAGQFPSWRQADPAAVEVLVEGVCRLWTAAIGERHAESSNRRYRELLHVRAAVA